MARFIHKRKEQVGQAPGSFIFTGEIKTEKPRLRVIDFGVEHLHEIGIERPEEAVPFSKEPGVTWLNIDGLHDIALMERICELFAVPHLIMEDILHTGQTPKVQEFEGGIFITLKMLRLVEEGGLSKVLGEQVSLVLLPGLLITFQEQSGDVFEPVRERIRQGRKRMRASGPDYLAYALLDLIVDNYGYILSSIGDAVEALDGQVVDTQAQEVLDDIGMYKREISYMRRVLRPVKDLTLHLAKMEHEMIKSKNQPFYKDLSEHAAQAVEAADSYRELLSDQLNIYHTVVSSRMNDIMKVLTIFAAIFIPLTFIAGIYGTNFDYLPELHYRYSYFIMWGVMLAVAVGMLAYFRSKKWL
jgi:magnesium transporter